MLSQSIRKLSPVLGTGQALLPKGISEAGRAKRSRKQFQDEPVKQAAFGDKNGRCVTSTRNRNGNDVSFFTILLYMRRIQREQRIVDNPIMDICGNAVSIFV